MSGAFFKVCAEASLIPVTILDIYSKIGYHWKISPSFLTEKQANFLYAKFLVSSRRFFRKNPSRGLLFLHICPKWCVWSGFSDNLWVEVMSFFAYGKVCS